MFVIAFVHTFHGARILHSGPAGIDLISRLHRYARRKMRPIVTDVPWSVYTSQRS